MPVLTLEDEIVYLSGVTSSGQVAGTSYWTDASDHANKWGSRTPGTGAAITYAFDSSSGFTAAEKATFLGGFALWSAVANVTFSETTAGSANVLLRRGNDGSAYEDGTVGASTSTLLGAHIGQALISIDTSVAGFELTGSFATQAGYGIGVVAHEIGHLLGLGHGGNYNGDVTPSTDQYSPYDERMWTMMSYISWGDSNAKYHSDYPVTGTVWNSVDGTIDSSYTPMIADILAVQRLYGAPVTSALDGGDVFGFHSTITGALGKFFDFTIDTHPVVTLFSTGAGNTFDVSGFSQNATINLASGTFSSVGGMTNNVSIDTTTVIENGVGGSGADTIYGTTLNNYLEGNAGVDILYGYAGADILSGGAGNDTLYGGDGADVLIGGTGDDALFGGVGADMLYAGDGRDSLYGGTENDVLIGGVNFNVLSGDDGDDYMYLYYAGGQAYGGAGNDVAVGNMANDTFIMAAGNDVAYGYGGNDYFYMGDGADVMYGGEGVDVLLGEAGNDFFDGGAGVDYLFLGTAGTDTIWFAAGSGVDVVNDFHPGEDLVALVGTNLHSFADVVAAASDYGSFTVVTTGSGEALWFIGLHTTDLRASDFYFY